MSENTTYNSGVVRFPSSVVMVRRADAAAGHFTELHSPETFALACRQASYVFTIDSVSVWKVDGGPDGWFVEQA